MKRGKRVARVRPKQRTFVIGEATRDWLLQKLIAESDVARRRASEFRALEKEYLSRMYDPEWNGCDGEVGKTSCWAPKHREARKESKHAELVLKGLNAAVIELGTGS